ncbi:MAG: hypothetical protein J3R72DRAFT_225953 [Linnemannia gamsii]|nr:MAG: hypothetical protein J3R72DRAFT_225953 [Linnemannia gamsii]
MRLFLLLFSLLSLSCAITTFLSLCKTLFTLLCLLLFNTSPLLHFTAQSPPFLFYVSPKGCCTTQHLSTTKSKPQLPLSCAHPVEFLVTGATLDTLAVILLACCLFLTLAPLYPCLLPVCCSFLLSCPFPFSFLFSFLLLLLRLFYTLHAFFSILLFYRYHHIFSIFSFLFTFSHPT